MHSYLRAIGFSKLEQKDLDQILQEVIVSCDKKKIAEQGKNEIFAELSRYFGMNIGLRVCGTYDEQEQFRDFLKQSGSRFRWSSVFCVPKVSR